MSFFQLVVCYINRPLGETFAEQHEISHILYIPEVPEVFLSIF